MGFAKNFFDWMSGRGGFKTLLLGAGQPYDFSRLDEKTALAVSTVFGCVSIYSQTLAQLPKKIIRGEGRDTERLSEFDENYGPLVYALNVKPNDVQTPYEFWRCMEFYKILHSESFAEIKTRGNRIILEPLLPFWVEEIGDNNRAYRVNIPGEKQRVVSIDRMLHFRSARGVNPIMTLFKNSVNLARAGEQYAIDFFSGGPMPSGLLIHPAQLEEGGRTQLRKEIDESRRRRDKFIILEEGQQYVQMTASMRDAELEKLRRYQVTEICKFFGVPPHMLASDTTVKYNNLHEYSLQFVTYSLIPEMIANEQEIRNKLILPALDVRMKFSADGLLRGDPASRAQMYGSGRQWGWLSINDIRGLEDLPPIDSPGGDDYLYPVNMDIVGSEPLQQLAPPATIKQEDQADELPKEKREAEQKVEQKVEHKNKEIKIETRYRQDLQEASEPALRDALARVIRRESADIMRSLKKVNDIRTDEAKQIISKFYDDHPPYFLRQVQSIFIGLWDAMRKSVEREEGVGFDLAQRATAEADFEKMIDGFIQRQIKNRLSFLFLRINQRPDEIVDACQAQFDHWVEEDIAASDARDGVVRAGGMATRVFLRLAGVLWLIWRNTGSDSCEACQSLDGKKVGIDESFAQGGQNLEGGNNLTVSGPKFHPPLHKGCFCQIEKGD